MNIENYILNGLEVSDFEVDGIDYQDFPKFCDAYICSASIKENGEWREATDEELDLLNEDGDLVYSAIENFLY